MVNQGGEGGGKAPGIITITFKILFSSTSGQKEREKKERDKDEILSRSTDAFNFVNPFSWGIRMHNLHE